MRDFTAHYCTLLHIAFANIAHFGDFSTLPNVVGYAQNDTIAGFTIVTPQFQNIGNENFSLINFRPSEGMYDNITVNRLDEYGTVVGTYTWTESADDGTGRFDLPGWADENYILIDEPGKVSFVPGEAVYISASSDGFITSSGQVRTDDVSFQLCNGFAIAGNPYPVAIAVQDIVPSSTSEGGIEDTYDCITLNLLDEYGTCTGTYTWTASADDGTGRYNIVGWADDSFLLVDRQSAKLEPGQGALVSGVSSEHYITLPAPEFDF